VKRVAFAADYPVDLTHPLHRAVVEHAAVSRAEVLTWGPVGSATTLIWVDADRETATEMLESEPVAETSLVAGDGGTYAFTRQTEYAFADDLLDLVAAADVAFLPPLAFRADRTARFEAVGEADALGAFYAALSDLLDVSVESVHDFQRGDTPASLTDRQRAALDTALDLGYYDVPRAASVADVAVELDCATSTAGELLRKAEACVVRDAVGGA
jgi:predicted DNA binding protein